MRAGRYLTARSGFHAARRSTSRPPDLRPALLDAAATSGPYRRATPSRGPGLRICAGLRPATRDVEEPQLARRLLIHGPTRAGAERATGRERAGERLERRPHELDELGIECLVGTGRAREVPGVQEHVADAEVEELASGHVERRVVNHPVEHPRAAERRGLAFAASFEHRDGVVSPDEVEADHRDRLVAVGSEQQRRTGEVGGDNVVHEPSHVPFRARGGQRPLLGCHELETRMELRPGAIQEDESVHVSQRTNRVRHFLAVTLSPDLAEAVLERLGLDQRLAPDAAGLRQLYAAWCRHVPFDNLVKRIHLVGGATEQFPNGPPEAFFHLWLEHGTGGTCWPSSGGLHALLVTLGFDARRGSAAMYDNFTGPIHTHGTVLVRLDGVDHWVDSSMLTEVVLPLVPGEETRHDHPVSPLRAEPVDDLWRVWWTSAANGSDIGCLLLDRDVTAEHYLARYEASRDMSPFNTSLHSTRNIDGARITLAGGQRFERRAEGITSAPLGDDRDRVLIEEFGYSEAIGAQLPAHAPAPGRE